MPIIRITKIFRFEMAHALLGYDGPCKNIHGHSYKLFVTVSGKIKNNSSKTSEAMVIDFSELKKIVNDKIISVYDHALVLDKNVPSEFKKHANSMSEKIVFVNGMPTCEFLVSLLSVEIKKHLPIKIKLCNLKLQETATSFAEWFSDENT